MISQKEGERGIDGGLSRRMASEPSMVNTIDTPSVDEFVKKVEVNGGTTISRKMLILGVGYKGLFQRP
jgi:predicted enzyme related to lactoylglutathione lyase